MKSEISFRLRRPLGILTGTIDKLIITPSTHGTGFDVEVIDFKTNRFATPSLTVGPSKKLVARFSAKYEAVAAQMQFDFSTEPTLPRYGTDPDPLQPRYGNDPDPLPLRYAADSDPLPIDAQVQQIALDHQLQMQAYALAVRELMQQLPINKLTATLHFLHPKIEFQLPEEVLTRDACAEALDKAMLKIISSNEPVDFPVRPAAHCRICNFLTICPPGRQFLATKTNRS